MLLTESWATMGKLGLETVLDSGHGVETGLGHGLETGLGSG